MGGIGGREGGGGGGHQYFVVDGHEDRVELLHSLPEGRSVLYNILPLLW